MANPIREDLTAFGFGGGGGGSSELITRIETLEENVETLEDDVEIALSHTVLSSNEKEFGEWVDGRKTYIKTFSVSDGFVAGQDRVVTHNIENIDLDTIILLGTIKTSSGEVITLSRFYNTTAFVSCAVFSDVIKIYTVGAFTGATANITLIYAKTE